MARAIDQKYRHGVRPRRARRASNALQQQQETRPIEPARCVVDVGAAYFAGRDTLTRTRDVAFSTRGPGSFQYFSLNQSTPHKI